VRTVAGGDRLYHRGTEADLGVLSQVFDLREYSIDPITPWHVLETAAALHEAGTPPLIVDCGANIGASAVYLAREFPNARIVAIEPDPGNFELLRLNTAPLADVRLIHGGIASEAGTLRLTDPEAGEWGYRAGRNPAGRFVAEVEAVTIDSILEANDAAAPFFLKVDIEGAELDLFAKRGESLNRFPFVITELHDWLLDETVSVPFLEWHLAHGREMRCFGENFLSLSRSLRGDRPSDEAPPGPADRPRVRLRWRRG
jgi:FkbM family methyltransferase